MPKEDIRILLGRRIRHLRQERGWSQENLANRCGLDRSYIGGMILGILGTPYLTPYCRFRAWLLWHKVAAQQGAEFLDGFWDSGDTILNSLLSVSGLASLAEGRGPTGRRAS